MEAAVRTAHKLATGTELEGGPRVSEARGNEGVRQFTVAAADIELSLAVVNGLGRLQETLDELIAGDPPVHFVEVMSCPGGCVGGGGQPYGSSAEAIKERLARLYDADRRSSVRRSHENTEVQALYQDVLGRPFGELSHRLLHREYVDRRAAAAALAL
jgi:iron only hydrogenase large subunit-like protein